MTDEPKVSVVIPLYNKGPYIARTLRSVLSQSYPDLEVIVVDDGSNDDGAAKVRQFDDPRVRMIQQENQGVSSARNNGVLQAKADLIAFLDADDEWLPDFLRTIMRLRDKFPKAGAYVTSYVFHEQTGEVRPTINAMPPHPWEGLVPRYFLSSATGDCPISSSTLCMEKKTFWELGGYPIGIPYGEDALLWGTIALRHQVAFSWETGAIYHRDAKNRACVKQCSLEKEPIVIMLQEMLLKNEAPSDIVGDLIEYVNRLELLRARRSIMMGESARAREILSERNTAMLRRMKLTLTLMAYTPSPIFRFAWRMKRAISSKLFRIDYEDDIFFK